MFYYGITLDNIGNDIYIYICIYIYTYVWGFPWPWGTQTMDGCCSGNPKQEWMIKIGVAHGHGKP